MRAIPIIPHDCNYFFLYFFLGTLYCTLNVLVVENVVILSMYFRKSLVNETSYLGHSNKSRIGQYQTV